VYYLDGLGPMKRYLSLRKEFLSFNVKTHITKGESRKNDIIPLSGRQGNSTEVGVVLCNSSLIVF